MTKSSRVKSILTLALGLGISLFSCSCTSLRPGEKHVKDIREEKLGFIKLGRTTRNDVTHKLGPPTFTLRDNSIFVYRFCLNNRRRPTTESLGWHNDPDLEAATPNFRVQMGGECIPCGFHEPLELHEAVMVFDNTSVLRKYRLFNAYSHKETPT